MLLDEKTREIIILIESRLAPLGPGESLQVQDVKHQWLLRVWLVQMSLAMLFDESWLWRKGFQWVFLSRIIALLDRSSEQEKFAREDEACEV